MIDLDEIQKDFHERKKIIEENRIRYVKMQKDYNEWLINYRKELLGDKYYEKRIKSKHV